MLCTLKNREGMLEINSMYLISKQTNRANSTESKGNTCKASNTKLGMERSLILIQTLLILQLHLGCSQFQGTTVGTRHAEINKALRTSTLIKPQRIKLLCVIQEKQNKTKKKSAVTE